MKVCFFCFFFDNALKKLCSNIEETLEHSTEDVQYFDCRKNKEEILKFSEIFTTLVDCYILAHVIRKFVFAKFAKFTAGIVDRIYFICETCNTGTNFYTSNKHSFPNID